jgi:hypothetical protein
MQYTAIITLVTILAWPVAAQAAENTRERASYQQLLRQRHQLVTQLSRLDEQAAAAVRRGEDPVQIHAQQIGLQDQLDLVELRLELTASRLGEDVPPIETVGSGPSEQVKAEARARRALERGVSRTMRVVQRDAKAMLASLNFARFLGDAASH